MMKKILSLLLLFLLMAVPAFASTLTVTYVTPASGESFNNLPANVRPIDINVTLTDDNASVHDMNLIVTLYDSTFTANRTIADDLNVHDVNLNPTVAERCTAKAGFDTGFTCNIKWTLPINADLAEGTYYIDVNFVDYIAGGGAAGGSGIIEDTNATRQIVISNKIPTGQTTRDLMAIVGVILAAVVLLGGLGAILVLKTDIAKTAVITVVAAIAVAIAAMLIGIILIPLV